MLQKITALFIGLGKKVKETFNKEIVIAKVEEAKEAVNTSVSNGISVTSKWVDETKGAVADKVDVALTKTEEIADEVKEKSQSIIKQVTEKSEEIVNECKNRCVKKKEESNVDKETKNVETTGCVIDEVAADMHSSNSTAGETEVLTDAEIKERMTQMSDVIMDEMIAKSTTFVTGKFSKTEIDKIETFHKAYTLNGGVILQEHVEDLANQLNRNPKSIKTKLNQLSAGAK